LSTDLIYNGEFFPSDKPILSINNRSFRYGDGLFESIRVINGEVYNFHAHFSRLSEGMKVFMIEIPEYFTINYFNNQIKSLLQHNGIHNGGRVKLTIYRKGEVASYFSETNEPGFIIEAEPFPNNDFILNPEGIDIDVYRDMMKPNNKFSSFKTTNAFFYVNAIIDAKQKGLGDNLLINESNNIIESTNSNFFIVSNGVLYTPPLASGCVGGTMRMKIINLALENGIKIYESPIIAGHLLSCDEIILTNAIQGVKWVRSYKTKRFFHKTSDKLIELLNYDTKAVIQD
jgi:branched-subunit amino acid aminotransferase/4-amino-4-deoxychorismate lyase|tara:strand:- start:14628 stop:15488 length:861 start_codon:yes stop_codon:yes gene_type:complete